MKPLLHFKHHVWTCRSIEQGWMFLGFGYSELEAYADWQQCVPVGRFG